MKKFLKNLLALCFIIFGAFVCLLGFVGGYGAKDYIFGTIFGVIGIILVFLGIKIIKMKSTIKNVPDEKLHSPIQNSFSNNSPAKSITPLSEIDKDEPTPVNEIKENEETPIVDILKPISPESIEAAPPTLANTKVDFIETYVAGLGFENRRKNLKKLINKLIKDEYIEANYDGYTNKEIKDDYYDPDQKYWRIVGEIIPNTFLIPEPSNEFDPNAIRVEVSDDEDDSPTIVVGYLKKSIAKKVKKYLEDGYKVSCDSIIQGGKYKYLDDDEYGEEKVFIDEVDYSLALEITVKE